MIIKSQTLTFAQIADAWAEEENDEDRFVTSEQISCFLIQAAAEGEFEFVNLSENHGEEKKAVKCLFNSHNLSLEKQEIVSWLQELFGIPAPYASKGGTTFSPDYYATLNKEQMLQAHLELASQIYISKEDFFRWCRIRYEDHILFALRFDDEFKAELPTFWGFPWKFAIKNHISNVSYDKKYSLSEFLKFFLDYEIWQKYTPRTKIRRLIMKAGKKEAKLNEARRGLYNKLTKLFIEAEKELKSRLSKGEIILEAFQSPVDHSKPRIEFKSELIELMDFDYAENIICLDEKIYRGVRVSLPNVGSRDLVETNSIGRGDFYTESKIFIEQYIEKTPKEWLSGLPESRFNFHLYSKLKEAYCEACRKKDGLDPAKVDFPAETTFDKQIRPKLIKKFPEHRLSGRPLKNRD